MRTLGAVTPPRLGDAEAPAAGHRPSGRVWQGVVAVVVPIAVFGGALPRIAGYDAVWAVLRDLDGVAMAAMALAATWNIVTYWFLLMAALPGLRLGQAAVSNQASTAVSNVVPGGGAWGLAVTWAMYREWGFSREASGRALLLTAMWNSLAKLALPLLALGVAALSADDDALPIGLGLASLAALGLGTWAFAASVRSAAAAARAGAVLGAVVSRVRAAIKMSPVTGWDRRAEELQANARLLVERRWLALTIAAVVSHLSLFLVLVVSLRVVGVVGVGWIEALSAFALVRVALIVPVTPGGAGLAELGLVGMLVTAGGMEPEVVAAVLLFRAATWLLPVIVGGAAYGAWILGSKRSAT